MNNKLSKIKIEKEKISENYIKFIEESKVCLKEFANKETRKKQIPNALTASRLLSPIFILPAAFSKNLALTSFVITSISLTDALDGYFARKFNVSSEYGKNLDAITDKLFAASLLIPLAVRNKIFINTITLEALIALINMGNKLDGKDVGTVYIGKVKTAFLSSMILLNYIDTEKKINKNILNAFYITTTSLQLASLIEYAKNSNKKEETTIYKVNFEDLDESIKVKIKE